MSSRGARTVNQKNPSRKTKKKKKEEEEEKASIVVDFHLIPQIALSVICPSIVFPYSLLSSHPCLILPFHSPLSIHNYISYFSLRYNTSEDPCSSPNFCGYMHYGMSIKGLMIIHTKFDLFGSELPHSGSFFSSSIHYSENFISFFRAFMLQYFSDSL